MYTVSMVQEGLILPPGVALAIIAFLLSLLPAALFIWIWYLRRQDKVVPGLTVALAFLAGMVLVFPAFRLEDLSQKLWLILSPSTAHYFSGALLPLQSPMDIIFPAVGTFLLVAVIEEGLRYLVLYWWIKRSQVIDQIFDGLLVGVAAGLGFATLENTIYFLGLFQDGNYDTLVFVFFLRFIISTVAHVSFGGVMGTLIARGIFNVYDPSRYTVPAFFVPWFLHGLYDLLLGINQSFYAVLLLLPALLLIILWSGRRDFFTVHRQGDRLLVFEQSPTQAAGGVLAPEGKQSSPWNVHAPWLNTNSVKRFMDEKKRS